MLTDSEIDELVYVPVVGDIFYASWGYDQTQVNVFVVVGYTPSMKSVYLWRGHLKEADATEGANPNYSRGRVAPDISVPPIPFNIGSHYNGSPMDGKVLPDGSILKKIRAIEGQSPRLKMNSSSGAYLWDGHSTFYQTSANEGR